MRIMAKCDCGNEVNIPAPSGKYTQFRDNLETKHFLLDTTESKNGIVKEIKIECTVCKRRITLGTD